MRSFESTAVIQREQTGDAAWTGLAAVIRLLTRKKIKPVDIGLRAAPYAAPLPDAFSRRGDKKEQMRDTGWDRFACIV